jgi:hypothetical protein
MRILYAIIVLLFLSSCYWDAFPIEQYQIDHSFRDMVNPYQVGDTLTFQSSQGKRDSFLISKIDSTLNNRKGHFINARNVKTISVYYRQIPVDTWARSRIEMGPGNADPKTITEDATLIDIVRYPDDQTTELHFNLKIFYGCAITDALLLHTDTTAIAGRKFTNYYKIDYCADDRHTLTTTIKTAYSTIENGLVAYQYVNGEWWIRSKY